MNTVVPTVRALASRATVIAIQSPAENTASRVAAWCEEDRCRIDPALTVRDQAPEDGGIIGSGAITELASSELLAGLTLDQEILGSNPSSPAKLPLKVVSRVPGRVTRSGYQGWRRRGGNAAEPSRKTPESGGSEGLRGLAEGGGYRL